MKESYKSFLDRVRREIESGELPDGTPLPSIREYMEAENLDRGTVTRALARLRAEGLIASRQGKGNWVQRSFARIERRSPHRLARERWLGGKAIQDADTSPRPRTVNVVIGDTEPPAHIGNALGVKPGVKVLSRSRRFVVDDRPVQLAVSYLPTDLTRGTRIEHTDTGEGGTYARLAEQSWGPDRFTERVIARAPRPDEVAGTPEAGSEGGIPVRKSGPVFEVTRFAWSGERCVEVTVMVLDAEAYELVYDFPG